MRKFMITVNGVSYEVEVEEVAAGAAPVIRSAVPVQAPVAPAPAPVAAPAPVPAAAAPAAPVSAPKAAAPVAGGQPVKAPMPGTIVDIKVKAGDAVKKGSILLILEAMKMENEIISPVDGTVAQVVAAKGASVNANDVLVTIA